jgi:D-alanyl-D-alanine carboxypeptidase
VSETALRRLLEQGVGGRGVVGAAVAVGAGARPEAVWLPQGLPEEPGFLAYSITKTFVAVLLLQLQGANRVALDTPLARWFPRIAAADRITLRQLLNHSGGLPDYGGLRSYHDAVRDSPRVPWSFERFAAETFEKGLCFEPGAGWAYSNPGYMLLRRIAEEISGVGFAALVSDRIAGPLGLRRTFVAETLAHLAVLAPAPSAALSRDGRARDAREFYHPGWVSHGVVASIPSEITGFFDALFAGRLLPEAALREMTTLVPVPAAPQYWRRPSYGLGLMADPASPWGRLWGHSGGGPGYRSSAYHAAQRNGRRLSVTAMCAVEDDSIADQLVFAVFGAIAA